MTSNFSDYLGKNIEGAETTLYMILSNTLYLENLHPSTQLSGKLTKLLYKNIPPEQ